jgi:hypothetical protein
MQTWLVHMRRPVRLVRELGLRQFIGFNLIGFGMLVSAFIHPICLAFFAIVLVDPLFLWGDGSLLAAAAVGINLFNLFAGYAAMAVLSRRTLALRGRRSETPILFWLPLYWLLMSAACYRAFLQLLTQPHLWEKTPHRGRSGRTVPLAFATAERDRLSRRSPQVGAVGAAPFGRRAR